MRKLILLGIIMSFAQSILSQTMAELPEIPFSAKFNHPLIVGHRGGFESTLPENSISMFDFTYYNASYAPIAIEFDVRESASGTLYIMHDITVDRTTNGTGKINELTDDYIKTLFLKDRNGMLTAEKAPLFEEILRHFKDKNIVLMLDVKGNIYPKVIALVSQMQMQSKCILLTFSFENTKLVKGITDKIMISALVLNKANWDSLQTIHMPVSQLITYISNETPQDVIELIHKSKVLLMTDMSEGTTNDAKYYKPDEYRDIVIKKHLTILISDYPLHVSSLYNN